MLTTVGSSTAQRLRWLACEVGIGGIGVNVDLQAGAALSQTAAQLYVVLWLCRWIALCTECKAGHAPAMMA
jgi:hypothetical protein